MRSDEGAASVPCNGGSVHRIAQCSCRVEKTVRATGGHSILITLYSSVHRLPSGKSA
jgi:hypothetical protein